MKFMKKLLVPLLALACVQPVLALSFFDNLNIGFLGESEGVDRVVWEDGPNRYVKYDKQDSSTFGKNDHPVELDRQEIAIALSLLKVKAKGDPVPVFTREQIALLSKNLAEGFKSVAPGQDIIFAMEKSEAKLLGLKKNAYFVAGRAFYKEGKLNLILGDFDRARNIGYEAAYDPSNAGIVTYNFDHGKRTKQSAGSYAFNNVTWEIHGIQNMVLNGARRDWFLIDLHEATQGFATREEAAKQNEMIRKRREIEEILGQPIPGYATPVAVPVRSAEDRLVSLNSLKEKGLISEEEYAIKRKQILDEL
ncbi:SHOCT domain-containing protein [Porticoccus sp.]